MSENEEPAAETTPVAAKKEKKKRLKGLAGTISNLIKPANDSERFKEFFAEEVLTLIVAATDLPPAALIHVDHGTVETTDIPLEDVKKTKADGKLIGNMDIIMGVASGKIGAIGAFFKGKIKVKGVKNILKLRRIFVYAIRQMKAGTTPTPASKPEEST
jgi:putative sterol carrier protein